MGLNPTILRQAQDLTSFSALQITPAVARHPYRERFRFYGARGGRWRLRRGNQTMERPYVKAERLGQMPSCA
jgi:hypothetical protein